MGSCGSRLKREMAPVPVNSGNWTGFAPQRPEAYVPREHRSQQHRQQRPRQQMEKQMSGNGAPLGRFETPTGIPGLTYDHAGRPVWREENAVKGSHEHKEHI